MFYQKRASKVDLLTQPEVSLQQGISNAMILIIHLNNLKLYSHSTVAILYIHEQIINYIVFSKFYLLLLLYV